MFTTSGMNLCHNILPSNLIEHAMLLVALGPEPAVYTGEAYLVFRSRYNYLAATVDIAAR